MRLFLDPSVSIPQNLLFVNNGRWCHTFACRLYDLGGFGKNFGAGAYSRYLEPVSSALFHDPGQRHVCNRYRNRRARDGGAKQPASTMASPILVTKS